MKLKKLLPLLLAAVLLLSAIPFGMAAASGETVARVQPSTPVVNETEPAAAIAPKYVFLFIGDGMTYPQFQAATAYRTTMAEKDTVLSLNEYLNFMSFPVAGSCTTYDSSSFCRTRPLPLPLLLPAQNIQRRSQHERSKDRKVHNHCRAA